MSKKSHAEYKAQRRLEMREMSALRAKAGLTYACGKLDPDVVAARLAEIPRDTRSLTQRMFGDPLPGRDALSRKHGEMQ